jgi:hypothetical protein
VYRPLSVLMATTLGTIRSEESILAAAQRMREKRIGKENGVRNSFTPSARGGFSSVLSAPTMHRQLFSEQLVPTVCPTGCEPLQGDGVM